MQDITSSTSVVSRTEGKVVQSITREQSQSIYRAGEEAVVRVLLEMDKYIHDMWSTIQDLEQQVQDLTVRLNASERQVRQLEEKAAKDSHNSSKPPSSDGLNKPKPKSLRQPSERTTGGQPGHSGHTLRMAEKIDHTVKHSVSHCVNCGRSLVQQAPDNIERRQVFDLPEPKLEVTEHQSEVKTCVCGCLNRAAFPIEVTAPVQYGLRVKSLAVYLKEYQLLPFDRLSEIMRDLFACKTFSEGTLANFSATCSRRLKPVDEFIHDLVTNAEVAGFDETGMRAIGSLHWLHTVSTRWLTWYFAHKRRGSEAMDSANILPNFRGRAVHDFWNPYLKYDCDHAFCNAHLLRELIFLWEEQNQQWAKTMIDHLLAIKTAVTAARNARLAALPSEDIAQFHARYLEVIETGYTQNPVTKLPAGPNRRGRRKQSKACNLLDRFRDHSDGILAFMHDFSVPFDNNLSERDLRMMKLRQKISGTFRSFDALIDFCRIRGYISTVRKNGLNTLDALHRVFLNNPFIPVVNTS